MSLLVVLLCLAGCSAPVTCGPGTELVGAACQVSTIDAGATTLDAGTDGGAATELPMTAVITPSPLKVMQGFAACPNVTLVWADGTSKSVLFDPTYTLELPGALRIAEAGFTLEWKSSTGLVGTSALPRCAAALVGLTAGTGAISLEAVAPDGTRRAIGAGQVDVAPLTPGRVSLTSLTLASRGNRLPGNYKLGEPVQSVGDVVAVGESVELSIGFDVGSLADAVYSLLPVPGQLVITSSAPSVVSVDGSRVTGLTTGQATVTASATIAGNALGSAQLVVRTSASRDTLDVVLDYPLDDRGFVLPEANRTASVVHVGQCFSFQSWAFTRDAALGTGGVPAAFLRAATTETTFAALGAGLTHSSANRFCATSAGEAAVRACVANACMTLGVLVTEVPGPTAPAPMLSATFPAEVHLPPMSGYQTVCADLQLTMRLGTDAPRDVSSSLALRFGQTFGLPGAPLYVDYDGSTGLPRRDSGQLCFKAQVDGQRVVLRIFWGNAQVEVQTLPKF